MKFSIEDKVFDLLPTICLGIVVARNIDNSKNEAAIFSLLEAETNLCKTRFKNIKPKDHPSIIPYRDAFRKMNVNPNKFPSSIEALLTRIAKGGLLPDINSAVNLVNMLSLKYMLPMGAHDLDAADSDLAVRFSTEEDWFIPFGASKTEIVEPGELVYAAGKAVKTRKWIWRQSDFGKVTESSKNIFFPIDGFSEQNKQKVLACRDELDQLISRYLGGICSLHFLDISCRSIII